MFPEGWRITRLGSVSRVTGGKRLPKGETLTEQSTNHPYIRVSDMRMGEIATSDMMYVPNHLGKILHRYTVDADDILISVAGTLGLVCRVPAILHGANLTENADRISSITCDSDFLYYTLLNEPVQASIRAARTTNAQPKLALDRIRDFKILLPPPSEQRKIAEILSTWDAAIGAQERLIANAKRQKKALMQTLLPTNAHTPKRRLPGFSGEWREIKLRELGRCYNGVTYAPTDVVEKGGLLILRSSNVQKGRLAFEDTVFVKPDVKTSCLTQEGDILICVRNGSRNLIGKTARITSDAAGHAHGAFMSLFRSTEPDFAYHLFQSDAYDLQVKRNLGATINSINTSDLHKFRFFVPPKPERARIAQILTASDSEIEQHEKLLVGMCTQKLALMQQLLTGKRRVQLDESEVV